jgi:hypothetical protein
VRAPSITSRRSSTGSPSRKTPCWRSAHFDVAPCPGDAAAARRHAARLERLAGVRSVTLNPICGTLHVRYDGASVSASELGRCFQPDAREARPGGGSERAIEARCWIPLLARAARALLASSRR